VRAERRVGHENPLMAERWQGTFSRQFILGDMLDTDDIRASYEAGVLTLRIPIAERAKPRKITVNGEQVLSGGDGPDGGDRVLTGATS
jgi:HSP20 family protein